MRDTRPHFPYRDDSERLELDQHDLFGQSLLAEYNIVYVMMTESDILLVAILGYQTLFTLLRLLEFMVQTTR